MSIVFVCNTSSHGSTSFRAGQLACAINQRYPGLASVLIGGEKERIHGLSNKLIIPILTVGDGLWEYFNVKQLEEIRKRGNQVYADILDSFVWPEYNPLITKALSNLFELLDGMIVYSNYVSSILSSEFKNLKFRVIPHQWDNRYEFLGDFRRAKKTNIRVVYSGYPEGFQLNYNDFSRHVDFVFDTKETTRQLNYRYHISYRNRDSLHALFKPAAKLATAAGVKALLFTSEDASAKEILGDAWPLYFSSKEEFFDKYDNIFKNPDMEHALLHYVETVIRLNLSPASIADKFIKLYFDSLTGSKINSDVRP
jgi:hypothetical protein